VVKETKVASKAPWEAKMGTVACHLATHRWAVRLGTNKVEWGTRTATPECHRAIWGRPRGTSRVGEAR
jgi:hypothetical protein